MSIIKEILHSEISDDIILKSLILIDGFENVSAWNSLLFSRTQNTEFVAPHIHIFMPLNVVIVESTEIELHKISRENFLIEMIKIMLDFKKLSSRIVIVTSNDLLISRIKRIEEHFELIFVDPTFITRLNKLLQ